MKFDNEKSYYRSARHTPVTVKIGQDEHFGTKALTLRRLMSYIYIYGAPILDVSRSHTTTQHSR